MQEKSTKEIYALKALMNPVVLYQLRASPTQQKRKASSNLVEAISDKGRVELWINSITRPRPELVPCAKG